MIKDPVFPSNFQTAINKNGRLYLLQVYFFFKVLSN